MKTLSVTGLCGLLLFGANTASAATYCLSSGPIENIGESNQEDDPDAPLRLASRFYTVQLLNNSAATATFEARFFQIDGRGEFEGGTPPKNGWWPATGKPKVLLSSGRRDPVAAGGAVIVNTDLGDDDPQDPSYAYEVQVKIVGTGARNEFLIAGQGRSEDRMKMVPEQRLLHREWTPVRCTW